MAPAATGKDRDGGGGGKGERKKIHRKTGTKLTMPGANSGPGCTPSPLNSALPVPQQAYGGPLTVKQAGGAGNAGGGAGGGLSDDGVAVKDDRTRQPSFPASGRPTAPVSPHTLAAPKSWRLALAEVPGRHPGTGQRRHGTNAGTPPRTWRWRLRASPVAKPLRWERDHSPELGVRVLRMDRADPRG